MRTYEDALEAQIMDENTSPITAEYELTEVDAERREAMEVLFCTDGQGHDWLQIEFADFPLVPANVFECQKCAIQAESVR